MVMQEIARIIARNAMRIDLRK